jgi:transglutaminase-like putative cysteine protease
MSNNGWRAAGAAALIISLCVCLPALGAQRDADELPYRTQFQHYTYEISGDGRSSADVARQVQVLQESAIDTAKTFSFSFSTSIEKGEVLEAYTLKKDGRKVPVPDGNYQREINQGRGNAGPFFSDRTRYSIVFPDLAVGDSVYVHYRTSESEPMFKGHFSMQQRFSPYAAEDDVLVTVRAPKDLPLRQMSNQVEYTETQEGDKRVMRWHYANPTPRVPDSDTDGGLWELKEYPNLFVSTFASYEAIAQAYGDRALPKAVPTPRVRDLAKTIVGNQSDRKQQARLIYEWVARNITYGGNCIGVGAVVPRDLDVVLDNRMGDCKDHATLLQALLAAQDIRSEQVLINAGDDYELPAVPVVSMVNHVMNYLPEWDMYVDSTATDIPFGYLPTGSYSKQVLHVGREKAFAVIPGLDHALNRQQLEMTMKIATDGSASGEMHVHMKGVEAAAVRAYMRDLNGQAERDFVKNVLARSGLRGHGSVERGDVRSTGDQYEFGVKFAIDNYLRTKTGAMYFFPIIPTPLPVSNFSQFEDKPLPKRRQQCWGFHTTEKLDIDIPDGMELLTTPADADIKGSLVDFHSRYVRTGNHLAIDRSLDDKSPGSVCPYDVYSSFVKQAIPVGENLRTQVLYRRN